MKIEVRDRTNQHKECKDAIKTFIELGRDNPKFKNIKRIMVIIE